jgi:serine/threonine-protein kinase RsbW
MAKRSFSITIPSDDAAGRKVKERIRQALDENGFSHHSAWAVHLALEEALTNAIKHGNQHDPNKKVRIQATVTPRRIEIIIEDQGSGFERHHVPDPRREENLEKCSGRGIFLIESYMDKVEWSHGGRRLRMVRKNQESSPHPAT